MSLKHFSYRHFCQEYTKSQILTLTAINEDFFDFRFHYSVEVLLNGNAQTFHVVLNEVNVVESFFDPKVDVGVFGNNHLSALWRLVECKCQNNEAPVESIIGTFSNQTFRSQSEQTGEDRAIIKVNGDGNIAGLLKIAPTIAQLSSEGVPEWDIEPLNLPITYGRYKRNTLPKVVEQQKSKISKKQTYVYHCSDSAFNQKQQEISTRFTPLELQGVDDQDMG